MLSAAVAATSANATPPASRESRLLLAEIEEVFIDRFLHVLFVVLLPHLCPGPPVHVGDFVLERGSGGEWRRLAVHRVDRLYTFDEHVWITLIRVALFGEGPHDARRLDERFRVVEDGFVVQAEEPTRR